MKRLYLARDTRSNLEYNKYIGWKLLPTKEGKQHIKKINLIDTITSTFNKEVVDIKVIKLTKKAIWVEVV